MEAIKALAVSKIFGYVAGLMYLFGFIGLATQSYIIAAVFIFIAILLFIIRIAFDIIFIFKGVKIGNKISKKSNV